MLLLIQIQITVIQLLDHADRRDVTPLQVNDMGLQPGGAGEYQRITEERNNTNRR